MLEDGTELPILEHTTNTAGYTETVFALFDLLVRRLRSLLSARWGPQSRVPGQILDGAAQSRAGP